MRRISRHPLAVAALLLMALALLAAACAPAAAPPPPPTTAAPKVEAPKPAAPAATPTTAPASKPTGKAVKICYLTPLTGPLASIGLPQSIAVKMAQEDVNNTGGINRRP